MCQNPLYHGIVTFRHQVTAKLYSRYHTDSTQLTWHQLNYTEDNKVMTILPASYSDVQILRN